VEIIEDRAKIAEEALKSNTGKKIELAETLFRLLRRS